MVLLQAFEVASLLPEQIGDHRRRNQQQLSTLLDRLTARLGTAAVTRLKHRESYIPERQQSFAPVTEARLGWHHAPLIQKTTSHQAPRPVRLLLRPEAIEVMAEVPEGPPVHFRWRRLSYRAVKAEGPERISGEWWLGSGGMAGRSANSSDFAESDRTRDYYRIETLDGARFWLFRRGLYPVAGVRGGEAGDPDWFLHGFFS